MRRHRLEWGYELDHPSTTRRQFAAAGVPFHTAPTSTWNSIAERITLGNLRNAAENGLKHGATGYLNTDWGDYGHWQYLPVSYLGFGVGAAYSWCLETNRALDVPAAISHFAFDDPSGVIGTIAYDLGNVYQVPHVPHIHNSSVLFHLVQGAAKDEGRFKDDRRRFRGCAGASGIFNAAGRSARPDADLVKREFINAGHRSTPAPRAATLEETDKSICARSGRTIAEHTALWLTRNRPGGLADSLKHFDATPSIRIVHITNGWSSIESFNPLRMLPDRILRLAQHIVGAVHDERLPGWRRRRA